MKKVKGLKKDKVKKKLFKFHNETTKWLNELEFIQDEQIFLENLLSSHFLDLSKPKLYDSTRKLIKKLKGVENMTNELSDTLQIHNKHIATLTESLQSKGKKGLRKEHKKIKKDFEVYQLNFKYVKRKIFSNIKEIMKAHKQKLLISNQ
jgi:hypothetical protein